MKIEIYCDGSATTAEKPGGWAFVAIVDGVKVHESSGHLSKATNNVAEVTAAIRALEYADGLLHPQGSPGVSGDVILRSDSQLVLGYASGRFRCKAMHLLPLYLQLRKLFNKVGAKDEWVKGHNGDPNNERCDELAKAARQGDDDKSSEGSN